MEEASVTVRAVLERTVFRGARLVAGRQGLDRPVRWVHVLEIPQEAVLHGGELILASGVAFRESAEERRRYLLGLIRQEAAALTLELGDYLRSVPADMVELADRHGLPLIAFPQRVRFVDITQDVNGLILGHREHFLLGLERLGRELDEAALRHDGLDSILDVVYESLGRDLVYCPAGRVTPGLPSRGPGAADVVDELVRRRWSPADSPVSPTVAGGRCVLAQPVFHRGVQVAALLLVSASDQLPWHEGLVLGRVGHALGEWEARRRRGEELALRRGEELALRREAVWVDDLLRGRFESETECLQGLGAGLPQGTPACCALLEGDGENVEAEARRLLAAQGFRACASAREDGRVLVLLDQRPQRPAQPRLEVALEQVAREGGAGRSVSVGDFRPTALQAAESLREAELTRRVSGALGEPRRVTFFAALGIYQLLGAIADRPEVGAFMQRELGGLLAYDAAHGDHLAETLEAYLATGGRPVAAAARLGIHRQTFYYRLAKLRRLLGEGLTDGRRRLGLEVALAIRSLPG